MHPARRATRPALSKARGYRVIVPALLAVLALITVVVLVLAGGVLFGLIPYPGR
ncbi:MAG TPA: hypothetical protein VFH67_06580 [bacterium]|nr:hypothetical protein [bacterium]